MLNYLNLPMQIEITGPSKSGRAANTRILIFSVQDSKVEQSACKITPSTGRLLISTIHCLKMKIGAVRLLRRVVCRCLISAFTPGKEFSMVSPEFPNRDCFVRNFSLAERPLRLFWIRRWR